LEFARYRGALRDSDERDTEAVAQDRGVEAAGDFAELG